VTFERFRLAALALQPPVALSFSDIDNGRPRALVREIAAASFSAALASAIEPSSAPSRPPTMPLAPPAPSAPAPSPRVSR